MNIQILNYTGDFGEDKDEAKKIRQELILPFLDSKQTGDIIIDFKGVDSVTQSFIHALLKEIIREKGIDVLDRIQFMNCNNYVKTIITIVVEYIEDSMLEN